MTVEPISDRDRDAFLSAIESPPEPNPALRSLMARKYRQNVAESIIEMLFEIPTEQRRQEVMTEVGKVFCVRCWKKLEGRKCFCDPAYDI